MILRAGCVEARRKVTLPPRERGGICTLGCVVVRRKVTLPPRERGGFCTLECVVVRRNLAARCAPSALAVRGVHLTVRVIPRRFSWNNGCKRRWWRISKRWKRAGTGLLKDWS